MLLSLLSFSCRRASTNAANPQQARPLLLIPHNLYREPVPGQPSASQRRPWRRMRCSAAPQCAPAACLLLGADNTWRESSSNAAEPTTFVRKRHKGVPTPCHARPVSFAELEDPVRPRTTSTQYRRRLGERAQICTLRCPLGWRIDNTVQAQSGGHPFPFSI